MNLILIDALIGNDYSVCLATALYEQGINLTFIIPSNRNFKVHYGFHIKKWIPSKNKGDNNIFKAFIYIIYLLKTTLLILSKKNTIVHFQFFRFKTDILFILFLRLLNVRVIYTAHNILPHERKKIDYLLYLILYKFVNNIIVHSDLTKTKLLNGFNITQKKVVVIPHGNFDIYIPKNILTVAEARKYFNLNTADKVLLFFGYIKEYKGLDLLLDAYKILLEKHKDIILMIAGFPATKQLLKKYKSKIDSMCVKNKIILEFSFIPSEEVGKYFISADYIVLPYKRIDHSGIVHLAYSFNKPIIATKVGDFEESIEDGRSGFLVNSQKPEDFASKIIYAFEDKNKIANMSRYISSLNETKYSWNEIAKKTINVYEKF